MDDPTPYFCVTQIIYERSIILETDDVKVLIPVSCFHSFHHQHLISILTPLFGRTMVGCCIVVNVVVAVVVVVVSRINLFCNYVWNIQSRGEKIRLWAKS